MALYLTLAADVLEYIPVTYSVVIVISARRARVVAMSPQSLGWWGRSKWNDDLESFPHSFTNRLLLPYKLRVTAYADIF